VGAHLHRSERVTDESAGDGDFLLVRGPFLHGRRHGVCVSSILRGHGGDQSTRGQRDVNEPRKKWTD